MGKKKIVARAKDVPGLIYIDRRTQDDAIVISASLTVRSNASDMCARVADALEVAAREVREQGGIVGHIKASVSITSTKVVSVTDEESMVSDSPLLRAQIAVAAILFLLDVKDAENIIRKSLAGIRARLKADPSGEDIDC